nr:hypothetical protein [Tanacetum cinerariifolium]
VPDEPRDSDNSSSSASEDEIEDISSNEADDTKKADIEKGFKEQVAEENVVEKQAGEEEHCDDQGGNE